MRFRPSLLTKVLLIAFGNLLVLGFAFLALIHFQLRLEVESFLVSPARARILAAARLLALRLGETGPEGWDALIARHAAQNRVGMRLIDEHGDVLAGDKAPLPPDVVSRFLARHENFLDHEEWEHRRGGRRGDSGLVFLGAAGSPLRHWAAVPAHVGRRGLFFGRGQENWILVSSSGQDDLFSLDPTPWIIAALVVIVISVAFWLPFVRGLTRSILRMTAATAQIAEGRFETRLPAPRRDELGVLSSSISKMAVQLERLVGAQKRFLRDAAHELRSPIARIQVALGLLERSPRTDQLSVLQDLHEDVQHMSALVDDVLSYSRVDQRAIEPHLQTVKVLSAVQRAVDREAGASRRITFSIEEQLAVHADPDLLVRALSNVLRNAIRYAGDAGDIAISAAAEGAYVVLSVADSGPGVPDNDLDAIFEPFYRTESSRGGPAGVGLGLAIVRSAVEACSGTVHCRNRKPHGFEVIIRLHASASPKSGAQSALSSIPAQKT